jgi:hypothetical protein
VCLTKLGGHSSAVPNNKWKTVFNSFVTNLPSKVQVGSQKKSRKAREINKGKVIMQNYMQQYITHCSLCPNISSEDSHNKQHSP